MSSKLTFHIGSQCHEVILNDAMKWSCDDPQVQTLLNDICPVSAEDDFSNLLHKIFQAGERLGAEVHFDRSQPAPGSDAAAA